MIIRFGVSNFLSIRDKQELSLVASSLQDYETGLIVNSSMRGRFLPVAVIYGANASGKSNIVRALSYMRGAVLYSHSRGDPSGGVRRDPFALDEEYAKKSSIFDIDFVIDNTRFHYGFEASDEAFVAEWLWAFPAGKRQILFRREGQKFDFGRSLKGQVNVIKDLTRPNSLFISAAAQNNHEESKRIVSFFRSIEVMDSTIIVESPMAVSALKNNKEIDRIIDFIKRLDGGIVGYRRSENEIPEEVQQIQQELLTVLNKFSKDDQLRVAASAKEISIELAHRGCTGQSIYFNMARESAGTRRLLVLMDAAFRCLNRGSSLIIDELDVSLHTQACEAIIAMFSLPELNPKGSQLIATTHNTNLLNPKLLRRDEIWFTEKDPEGATQVYPLTDIRTRHGDNLEKGYLQGRYGAVPYLGDAADFVSGQ